MTKTYKDDMLQLIADREETLEEQYSDESIGLEHLQAMLTAQAILIKYINTRYDMNLKQYNRDETKMDDYIAKREILAMREYFLTTYKMLMQPIIEPLQLSWIVKEINTIITLLEIYKGDVINKDDKYENQADWWTEDGFYGYY